MKILSLDPSSTKTGWAVMRPPEHLVEAGIITPAKTGLTAPVRILQITRDIRTLLKLHRPETVLLEWVSQHVQAKRHHGGGAGLAVYGLAVGVAWEVCLEWRRETGEPGGIYPDVVTVAPNDWTAGRPKRCRQAAIAAMFRQYDPAKDAGGDLADAIGLGVWWLRERAVRMLEGAAS